MGAGTRIRIVAAGVLVLALGLVTGIPLAVHFLRERKRKASAFDR